MLLWGIYLTNTQWKWANDLKWYVICINIILLQVLFHVVIIVPYFQVPLGILMKNEMEYTDMIDILEHVNTYVPTQSMITTAAYPNPLIGSPVPIKH